jgi:hypothetical protein
MAKYDLYGCRNGDIDSLAKQVMRILDVVLEPRNSSFLGDYYRFRNGNGESFVLQENYNPEMDDWMELEFTEFSILFYVNDSQRSETIAQHIEKQGLCLELIRSKTI